MPHYLATLKNGDQIRTAAASDDDSSATALSDSGPGELHAHDQ